jgi:hypothetical protein
MARASMSVLPPGVKGTTRRTVLALCAKTENGMVAARALSNK